MRICVEKSNLVLISKNYERGLKKKKMADKPIARLPVKSPIGWRTVTTFRENKIRTKNSDKNIGDVEVIILCSNISQIGFRH